MLSYCIAADVRQLTWAIDVTVHPYMLVRAHSHECWRYMYCKRNFFSDIFGHVQSTGPMVMSEPNNSRMGWMDGWMDGWMNFQTQAVTSRHALQHEQIH